MLREIHEDVPRNTGHLGKIPDWRHRHHCEKCLLLSKIHLEETSINQQGGHPMQSTSFSSVFVQQPPAEREWIKGARERWLAVAIAAVAGEITAMPALIREYKKYRQSIVRLCKEHHLMVILTILMSSWGLSVFGWVFTWLMLCTASMPRLTRPNIVCLLSSQGCTKSKETQHSHGYKKKVARHVTTDIHKQIILGEVTG